MDDDPFTGTFTLTTYPRSFAAIDRMRLRDYLHLSVAEQESIFHELERFCIDRAKHAPRHEYEDYPFLGAGWEWSVFRKDQDTVIKVPSGIFPETNDPRYLENVKNLYKLLGNYYPQEMLAATTFRRERALNVMEQQFIQGNEELIVPWNSSDMWLLQQLVVFFTATATLIQNEQWMPDFWLTEMAEGFRLRSVLVDRDREQFKIIDFSHYLDPHRMYPALQEWCSSSFLERIGGLQAWATRRLQDVTDLDVCS